MIPTLSGMALAGSVRRRFSEKPVANTPQIQETSGE
jgi:hypothetical protein